VRHGVSGVSLLTACLLAIPCSQSWAQATPHATTICDSPQYRGTDMYNKYCSRGGSAAPAAPVGPSPEELHARAEAKDLDEAAQDADDKGVAAYKRGDYPTAIQYFTKAIGYNPDDDVLRRNLARAREKLAASQAPPPPSPPPPPPAPERQVITDTPPMRQLKSVATDKPDSDRRETLSQQARTGFDTAGRDRGGLTPPVVRADVARKVDPVVPAAKLTPAIEAMQKARSRDREKIAALTVEMKTLDPKTDAVKIAKARQEITTTTHDVQYQNFSITEALEKPSAAGARKP
jgi:tetratricopeptide (TPR) repeat protein